LLDCFPLLADLFYDRTQDNDVDDDDDSAPVVAFSSNIWRPNLDTQKSRATPDAYKSHGSLSAMAVHRSTGSLRFSCAVTSQQERYMRTT